MMQRDQQRIAGAAILLATLGLPLVGAMLAGRTLDPLLRFPPPLAIPSGYPTFSWIAFLLVVIPFAAIAISWLAARRRRSAEIRVVAESSARQASRRVSAGHTSAPAGRFPTWGWLAVAWTFAWWVLAWTRFAWFAPLQRYTFFPLWLGFIFVVNALTTSRTGTCAMLRAPGRWVALFGGSAVFWWVFEWLNRFTHNWHYLGVDDFGAFGYALHATVCFSTVLPAVASVCEWLQTHPAWDAACRRGPSWPWLAHRATGLIFIIAGLGALLSAGAMPDRCYAALWAAPLALLLGHAILRRQPGIWDEVAGGDWRRLASWSVAALVCGFFWELWNFQSAAKWIYTVPFVERWHLFEMPLLGYLGYLPFGIECCFVVALLFPTDSPRPFSSERST